MAEKGVQLAFVLLSMESSSHEMNLGIYPFPGFLTGCAALTFNDQKSEHLPDIPMFLWEQNHQATPSLIRETFKSDANLLHHH